MGYPTKDKLPKEIYLYKWQPMVAETLIGMRPGDVKFFFCDTHEQARKLRYHILAFCKLFYGYQPFRTAIEKCREGSEWKVEVDGFRGEDVKVEGQ